MPRAQAIARLAAHRAERDAYLIAIPPSLIAPAALSLGLIRECVFYLDSAGTGDLVTAHGPDAGTAVALTAALAGIPVVAVAVIPKTVAAVAVCAVLGEPDMDDDRDLRALLQDDESTVWPRFLLDALAGAGT